MKSARLLALALVLTNVGAAETWADLVRRGGELAAAGDAAGARELYGRALQRPESAGIPAEPLAMAWNNLGSLAHELGDWQGAVSAYRRAIEIVGKIVDGSPERLAGYTLNLATAFMDQGRFADADRVTSKAAALLAEHPSIDQRTRARFLTLRAGILSAQGKATEAAALAHEALELARRSSDAARETSAALNNLAVTSAQRGDMAMARTYVTRAIGMIETVSGPAHPELLRPLMNLAEVALKQRRHAEAVSVLARAMAIAEAQTGMSRGVHTDLLRRYAWALKSAGRKDEARQAIARAEASGTAVSPQTIDIYTLSARPSR